MSVKYKLISRKLAMGTLKGKTVYMAQPVHLEEITFKQLCTRIAEYSAVTSADVKAVIDRMLYVMNEELTAGRVVRLGELGSFRLTFGSKPVEKEEDFNASLIRTPKIRFIPAKELRLAATTRGSSGLVFQRVSPETSRRPKPKPTAPEGSGGNATDPTA